MINKRILTRIIALFFFIMLYSLPGKAQHCLYCFTGYTSRVLNPVDENNKIIPNLKIYLTDSLKNILTEKDILGRMQNEVSTYPKNDLAYKMYADLLKEAETNTNFPFFNYASNKKNYIRLHKNTYERITDQLKYFIDYNIYPYTTNVYIKYFKTSFLRPKKTDLIVITDPSGIYETQYINYNVQFSNLICSSNFFDNESKVRGETVKMVKRH